MKVRLWKVVLGVLIVALLVGGGAMLYRAGYMHGVMSDVTVEALPYVESSPAYAAPYGMHGYYGHMGFFPLGRLLFGMLFFFLLAGFLFRGFAMRRHWMMHRMAYAGKGGPPWKHHGYPYWSKEDADEGDETDDGEEKES